MPDESERNVEEARGRRVRWTVAVILIIIIETGVLAAVKLWVTSRYLLGH